MLWTSKLLQGTCFDSITDDLGEVGVDDSKYETSEEGTTSIGNRATTWTGAWGSVSRSARMTWVK